MVVVPGRLVRDHLASRVSLAGIHRRCADSGRRFSLRPWMAGAFACCGRRNPNAVVRWFHDWFHLAQHRAVAWRVAAVDCGTASALSPAGLFLKRRSHARLSADFLERLYLRTTVPLDRGECRHWLRRIGARSADPVAESKTGADRSLFRSDNLKPI